MTVRAPFSGRLAAERTEVGAWLAEGAVVSELTDLSVVHAMVPMPEGEVSGVHLGDVVEVAFDALPGSVFTGKVSAIVPRGDPASRTFPVEVSIPNRDGRILAGMLARATFHRADGDHATLIPKDAFVPRPDGSGYVVRVEGDVAAIVPVQVLSSDGERFAVEGLEKPLAPGDRVVVRGNERLMSGQPLRDAAAP
jgi:RND family efflux transporter MFP subunit